MRIEIKLNKDLTEIQCVPDPARVKTGETISWRSMHGAHMVELAETPFTKSQRWRGLKGQDTSATALVRGDAARKKAYKYTVSVTLPGKTKPIVKDPEIIVDKVAGEP